MADVLNALSNVFTLAFVVTSMFSMGLGLTMPQILEPLRNVRLVIMALVANFVLVPLTALAVTRVIPLPEDVQIGLLLLGTAAGAPFLPKLAQIAKANVPFAVGLMALLVVVTVIYLPIVLPLLLPGVQVDAASIALTLILQILVPLALGLLIKARWEETAQALLHPMSQIANISLALLIVLMLGLNISKVLGLFGSGAILAILLMVVVAPRAGTCWVVRARTRGGCWPWGRRSATWRPASPSPPELRRSAGRAGLPGGGGAGGDDRGHATGGRVRQARRRGSSRAGPATRRSRPACRLTV